MTRKYRNVAERIAAGVCTRCEEPSAGRQRCRDCTGLVAALKPAKLAEPGTSRQSKRRRALRARGVAPYAVKGTTRCSECDELGHNRRTCEKWVEFLEAGE